MPNSAASGQWIEFVVGVHRTTILRNSLQRLPEHNKLLTSQACSALLSTDNDGEMRSQDRTAQRQCDLECYNYRLCRCLLDDTLQTLEMRLCERRLRWVVILGMVLRLSENWALQGPGVRLARAWLPVARRS